MEKIEDLKNKTVFVSGASGFLAAHCIKKLLQNNCKVIGSVRNLKKQSHKEIYEIVPSKKGNLKLVEADLLNSECWKKSMKGCDFLLHIASPIFIKPPKDQSKVLKAAIDGTTNVLEAAILNNIKKVVLISSAMSSIFKNKKNHFYKEKDFSEEQYYKYYLYAKTKTLAEKEAWKISEKYKGKLNLTVLRPGVILDETLTSQKSFSNLIIKLAFNSPILLDANFGVVSATDIAKACFKCLEMPEISRGKIYYLVENSYYFSDIVKILKDEFEKYGYWFYKVYVPNFIFWLPSKFSKICDFVYCKLNQVDLFDNDPLREDLKMSFENNRTLILRTVYSMIKNNKLRNKMR